MFKPVSPESLRKRVRAPLAAALAGWMTLASAGAETPLTEFNGPWVGRGTDRDSPLQTAQRTQCQTRVQADPTHMTSDMECNGRAGLQKRILLSVAFTGSRFTGSVEQTSVVRGSGAAPLLRAGSVTGNKAGDTAEFLVRFPGLTPNAHVVLELTSPTSFAMTVSSLGATLTKVHFRRPAAR